MLNTKDISRKIWEAIMRHDYEAVRAREIELLTLIKDNILEGDFGAALVSARFLQDMEKLAR